MPSFFTQGNKIVVIINKEYEVRFDELFDFVLSSNKVLEQKTNKIKRR